MRLVTSEFMSLDGVVKTVFPADGEERPLELARMTSAASGVLCCVYRPGETPPMPNWED